METEEVAPKVHMRGQGGFAACGQRGDVEILPTVEFEGLVAGARKDCCEKCVGVYTLYTNIILTLDDIGLLKKNDEDS